MFDLFGVPWSHLDRSDVERFLAEAGDEGVTWEAKGAGPDARRPRAAVLQKAACGLANQIGGYLIVGATRTSDHWILPGIQAPDEPALWIGQILRGLRPTPRFEVSDSFKCDDGNVALVVRIDPVVSPPCMTPDGRVYERVSGETLPVQDPTLLDRLFRRGDHARGRAEHFARRAAERAILLPGWFDDHSFSLTVGLASIGRETDDVSSRLFTDQGHEALLAGIWDLIGDRSQMHVDLAQSQNCYTALADSRRNRHTGPGGTLLGVIRSSQFVQANWDGSVAAGMWFSDDLLRHDIQPEQLVSRCWAVAAKIGSLLGNYGAASLFVLFSTATRKHNLRFGQSGVHLRGRLPPGNTLYENLPGVVEMSRLLESADRRDDVVSSIRRELQRAAGIRTDEPAHNP